MGSRTYTPTELREFLAAVDAALSEPLNLVLIGSCAVVLQSAFHRPTKDIDYFSASDPHALQSAINDVAASGIATIPLESAAAFATAPWNFEDRLEPYAGFTRLRIHLPDPHDLALMKLGRGYEHDMQAVEAMHAARPLDLDILVERYLSEMQYLVGAKELELSFLACIELLWGEASASIVEALLAERLPRGS